MLLDANSSVASGEITHIRTLLEESNKSTFANVEIGETPSTIANVEFSHTSTIDIYHAIRIPDLKDFPVEDFFRLPFSHHIKIIEGCKELEERYYFIHRAVEENIPSDKLPLFIKNNPYDSQHQMPSNFTKTIPDATQMRKAVTTSVAPCLAKRNSSN